MQIASGLVVDVMVFMGSYMAPNIRTPEDDEKKKLEQKLMELRPVATPVLEDLCSCSYRPYLEEPLHGTAIPSRILWCRGDDPANRALEEGTQQSASE
jgi:hypothetical protein